jgi:hypothetical protein
MKGLGDCNADKRTKSISFSSLDSKSTVSDSFREEEKQISIPYIDMFKTFFKAPKTMSLLEYENNVYIFEASGILVYDYLKDTSSQVFTYDAPKNKVSLCRVGH